MLILLPSALRLHLCQIYPEIGDMSNKPGAIVFVSCQCIF